MVSEYKLHIGSYGWLYKSWETSFYPEDLPVDWQFSYYGNEYSIVMIPWSVIENNLTLLKQGIEDSDDNCRLIFEFPVSNIKSKSHDELLKELHDFLNKITFIGSRGIGIVLNMQFSEPSNLSSEELDLVKVLLETSHAVMDTCIKISDINTIGSPENLIQEDLLTVLSLTGTDICRINDTAINLSESHSSKLHVTFCDNTNVNPKQMRKIVENSLVAECEGSTNVLIFQSAVPSHELMNTAAVISDLL